MTGLLERTRNRRRINASRDALDYAKNAGGGKYHRKRIIIAGPYSGPKIPLLLATAMRCGEKG